MRDVAETCPAHDSHNIGRLCLLLRLCYTHEYLCTHEILHTRKNTKKNMLSTVHVFVYMLHKEVYAYLVILLICILCFL
jgi:hypothetical protein